MLASLAQLSLYDCSVKTFNSQLAERQKALKQAAVRREKQARIEIKKQQDLDKKLSDARAKENEKRERLDNIQRAKDSLIADDAAKMVSEYTKPTTMKVEDVLETMKDDYEMNSATITGLANYSKEDVKNVLMSYPADIQIRIDTLTAQRNEHESELAELQAKARVYNDARAQTNPIDRMAPVERSTAYETRNRLVDLIKKESAGIAELRAIMSTDSLLNRFAQQNDLKIPVSILKINNTLVPQLTAFDVYKEKVDIQRLESGVPIPDSEEEKKNVSDWQRALWRGEPAEQKKIYEQTAKMYNDEKFGEKQKTRFADQSKYSWSILTKFFNAAPVSHLHQRNSIFINVEYDAPGAVSLNVKPEWMKYKPFREWLKTEVFQNGKITVAGKGTKLNVRGTGKHGADVVLAALALEVALHRVDHKLETYSVDFGEEVVDGVMDEMDYELEQETLLKADQSDSDDESL